MAYLKGALLGDAILLERSFVACHFTKDRASFRHMGQINPELPRWRRGGFHLPWWRNSKGEDWLILWHVKHSLEFGYPREAAYEYNSNRCCYNLKLRAGDDLDRTPSKISRKPKWQKDTPAAEISCPGKR